VSLSDSVALQQQSDTQVGGDSDAKLPSDRSAVRFTGYLMDADYSNVGKWDLFISRLVIQCDSCAATRDTYRKLGLRILLIF